MITATIRLYENVVGTLSNPSKMPGHGYGLPALTTCKTGAILAKVPGTTCSKCYACKGRYTFPNVRSAQMRRLQSLEHPDWVPSMVGLVRATKDEYFRWHDSGDVVSMQHLQNIVEVARQLPKVRFWLPTQEHALMREFLAAGGDIPENLCIRISSSKIDGRPPTTAPELNSSSVHTTNATGHECPAHKQGNKCGDCRACWNKEVKNVSYRYH